MQTYAIDNKVGAEHRLYLADALRKACIECLGTFSGKRKHKFCTVALVISHFVLFLHVHRFGQ